MKVKKFWTAHEKGTDKALVTIDASDDELFHKTAKKLGPVNWRNATPEEYACPYCGGCCQLDEDHACDGYLGDIDRLCAEVGQ